MKRIHSRGLLASFLAAVSCLPLSVCLAADTNSTGSNTIVVQPQPVDASAQASTQMPVAAPKLPYGVEDVLKLSRAQVGDEITINYVRNSGTIYTLGPQEIVYLRSQGVSDNVINAMIDQRKVVPQATPAPQAPAIANAPQMANAAVAPVAPDYSQVAPVYSESPASTVYVMPPPTYSYPYYGYPYYYGGPVISFGYGWGGYYGYHCYYGHGHGGYYHGSYGHGGGGHSGGHH